jgi:heme exporter protein C
MKWIYQQWWKWLSAVLLLYVVIGSFMVQLGPGITRVSPVSFRPDSLYTFRISAYHAHFLSPTAGKVQLWFKNQTRYFLPVSFKVIDNQTAEAQFALSSLQQDSIYPSVMDVVINDESDGTFALRDAVTLVRNSAVDSTSKFRATEIEPVVKNNHHHLFCFPYREILYETIRNTFFHVPMWFVMTMLVFTSFVASIMFYTKSDMKWDLLAHQSVIAALLFGTCGYLTGLVWAKYTWYIGVSWGDVLRKLLLEDIKMAAALAAMFFYFGYLVLRDAFTDKAKRANIAALYNILAFIIFVMCVFVLPRLTDSMHPGNGGNPAFSKYDLDSTLRLFFYPAVIGWILLGFWILSVLIRIQLIQQKREL